MTLNRQKWERRPYVTKELDEGGGSSAHGGRRGGETDKRAGGLELDGGRRRLEELEQALEVLGLITRVK
jgi:hypothetical protein